MVLEVGMKWQETNNAERFEKFLELKDSSARDIAIAFNIPPQLLGINGDNTYSNMQHARGKACSVGGEYCSVTG